jgi:uncharacterized protein (DUF433 family)
VTVILNSLAGGDSFETLEREFSITAEDIRACIVFSAEVLSQFCYHPIRA